MMRRPILCVIFSLFNLLTLNNFVAIEAEVVNNDTNNKFLIDKEININGPLKIIMHLCKEEVLLFVYNDMFNYYLPKYLNNIMCLWNVDVGNSTYYLNDNKLYYNNYIMLTDDENIYDLIESLRGSAFWKSGSKAREDKYFLFFFDAPNKTAIFEYLWKVEIINVLLFEINDRLDWDLFTYRPFAKESKCGNVIRPLPIQSLSNFKFREQHPNMKYCHLNMSYTDVVLLPKYFYDPPYVLLMPLHLLVELYELNYTYFSMPLEYQLNPIVAAINVKEQTADKEYDGIVGIPLRQLEYPVVFDNILELSANLGFDEFIWIIPRPKKIPNVRILLTIFSTSIYFVCLFTTSIIIIIWIYISKISKLDNYDVMGILSVTLGFGMKTPKLNVLKFVLVLYLFYTSHIIYFFQGNFSSKLLIPQYEERIKTMDELMDSEIQMQLHEMQRELLFTTSDMPLAKRLYEKIYSAPPLGFYETIECSELLNRSRTSSVRNSRASSTYDHQCAEYMDVLFDDISPNLAFSYVFRSGHPILTFLNRMIEIFQECGFVNKGYYATALPTNYNPIEYNASLTLEHFQACFLMLAIGIIVGSFIFLIEIVYYRHSNKI